MVTLSCLSKKKVPFITENREFVAWKLNFHSVIFLLEATQGDHIRSMY